MNGALGHTARLNWANKMNFGTGMNHTPGAGPIA